MSWSSYLLSRYLLSKCPPLRPLPGFFLLASMQHAISQGGCHKNNPWIQTQRRGSQDDVPTPQLWRGFREHWVLAPPKVLLGSPSISSTVPIASTSSSPNPAGRALVAAILGLPPCWSPLFWLSESRLLLFKGPPHPPAATRRLLQGI